MLAGWIGGLWAQTAEADEAFAVAVAGAYRHGAAADKAGVVPLRAADLVEALLRRTDDRRGPAGRAPTRP